ncbi:hypothetical protein HELRODRAFT_189288 [Helobdella robusta]|uniref:TFIID subunit TAF5 NTD2 domain-containing protein n=1 Tax=Helobdella robusta TaxID=6412 RepID=T1FQX2_HELRO|nr:hypothetical protein HELRODRAFT_189288 [Helobdella robusta]ESN96553.1 hypothetical protein HELRODRAFT_189288 [Helobdella robusta]
MKEFAKQCLVASRISASNLVAINSLAFNPEAMINQFNKLETFITENKELKEDLFDMLTPIALHLYSDLLSNGQKEKAVKFILDKRKLLIEDKTFLDIIDGLRDPTNDHINNSNNNSNHNINSINNSNNNINSINEESSKQFSKIFTELKARKFQLVLPRKAHEKLTLGFLNNQDNLYIHQLLNTYMDVSVTANDDEDDETTATIADRLLNDEDDCDGVTSTSTASKADEKKAKLDLLKKLSGSISTIAPCLPQICHMHMKTFSKNLTCAAMSPDERFLSCGYEDSLVRVVRIAPNDDGDDDDDVIGTSATTTTSNISNNGIHSSDLLPPPLSSSSAPSSLSSSSTSLKNDMMTLFGHYGAVHGVDYFQNGSDSGESSKWLFSCSADKTVRLWNTEEKRNVVVYKGHMYPVLDVASRQSYNMLVRFAQIAFKPGHPPSDYLFFCCSYHKTNLLTLINWIYFNLLSPISGFFASCSYDQTAKCVRLMVGHEGPLQAIKFSPDGKMLATAGDDHVVKLWDLGTGSLIKDFRGHGDVIYSLAFNRDGSLLFSGGMDNSLKMWDVFGSKNHATAATAATTATTTTTTITSMTHTSSSSLLTSSSPSSPSWSAPLLATSLPNNSCVVHMNFMKHNYLRLLTKQFD